MAEKGARAELEPLVRQKYIETGNLALSAEAYGVSRQSASDWKSRTKKPGEDKDEWDQARERKSSYGLRMEKMLDREMTHAENCLAGKVESVTLDNISKIGSLVVKFKSLESTGTGYDKGKVFLENLQWMVSWLRENDPEGLKTLAADFDAMTMQFKTELLG
jgi:transposase